MSCPIIITKKNGRKIICREESCSKNYLFCHRHYRKRFATSDFVPRNVCPYVLTHGKNKNKLCSRIKSPDNNFCDAHSKEQNIMIEINNLIKISNNDDDSFKRHLNEYVKAISKCDENKNIHIKNMTYFIINS